MKRFYPILLSVTILTSLDATSQWSVQQVPTTRNLYYVSFVDTGTGWLAGDDGIFHTTNGGHDWYLQDPQPVDMTIALTRTNCWAKNNTVLFHSTNEGISWTPVYLDSFFVGIQIAGRLCFVDSLNGWIPVSKGIGTSILRTKDGGNTWVPYLAQSVGALYDRCSFVDTSYGWETSRHYATIFETNDGGMTWDSIGHLDGTYPLGDMSFTTRTTGHVSMEGPGGESAIFKTTDGGGTWSVELLGECASVPVFCFLDSMVGWFAYASCLFNDSMGVFRTTDGGAVWDSTMLDSFFIARQIYFYDRIHGWIVTNRNYILHTSVGGVLTVQKEGALLPNDFRLFQNFPNPFNPSTTISFTLPKSAFVTIKIYNVLGQLINTLVNERRAPGTYNVQFDATNVPSGVYYYRLSAGEYVQTRKMLVLR